MYLAAAAVAVAGTMLAWKLCRQRTRVLAVITLAFVAGGVWSFTGIAYGQPDQGILALLFEVFLTFAALYWFDFRRTSTGVLTSIFGLLAWASVFPCEPALHLVSTGRADSRRILECAQVFCRLRHDRDPAGRRVPVRGAGHGTLPPALCGSPPPDVGP